MTSKLPFNEWCIIVLFCLILLALSAFAFMERKNVPAPRPSEAQATVVEVKIEGEVANPHLYQMPLKSTLKELLEKAQPLPTADLSKVSGRRRLRDKQTVRIPERQWITIEIAGMVQQPARENLKTEPACMSWQPSCKCSPEADMKSLKKRRSFLNEGDIVEVPAKKTKGSPKKKNK